MKTNNNIHTCAGAKLAQVCLILAFTVLSNIAHGQSNIITTICGQDSAGYCCDGEVAINAALNSPFGVQVDSHDNLFIDDALNHRIRKITMSTGIITTVAGTGIDGYSGDGGLATDAELRVPEAFFIDSMDNLYLTDAVNNRVRKVDAITGIITTIAGNGNAGYSGDGGSATNAQLDEPSDVCMDKIGNIYIADINNSVVRRINTDGTIITVAGNGSIGYAGDGGLAVAAMLNGPIYIVTDASNNLIISDYYNNRVRKVDIATGIITTIAGNGIGGYDGDGGAAIAAGINKPSGLTLDKDGNIYVCQYYHGVIRRIDIATGVITTIAGNGTEGFSGDGGLAIDAELSPTQMCFSSNGNIFVADEYSNHIRKISSSVGIQSVVKADNGVIYPNPSTGKFAVKYNNSIPADVTISNAVGATVATAKIDNNHSEIDISDQPNGVYFVNLKTDTYSKTIKAILAK